MEERQERLHNLINTAKNNNQLSDDEINRLNENQLLEQGVDEMTQDDFNTEMFTRFRETPEQQAIRNEQNRAHLQQARAHLREAQGQRLAQQHIRVENEGNRRGGKSKRSRRKRKSSRKTKRS